MAEQYPEAVYHQVGKFPLLHLVCKSLARSHCTPNMAKIGRFLISEHGGLARQHAEMNYRRFDAEVLPIHMIAHRCNRPTVQEVAVLLLKAYPESIEFTERWTIPFFQQVNPFVREELEVDQEISMLAQISRNMTQAVVLPANQSASVSGLNGAFSNSSHLASLAEVFCSWAD